jgi:hypothetical protein
LKPWDLYDKVDEILRGTVFTGDYITDATSYYSTSYIDNVYRDSDCEDGDVIDIEEIERNDKQQQIYEEKTYELVNDEDFAAFEAEEEGVHFSNDDGKQDMMLPSSQHHHLPSLLPPLPVTRASTATTTTNTTQNVTPPIVADSNISAIYKLNYSPKQLAVIQLYEEGKKKLHSFLIRLTKIALSTLAPSIRIKLCIATQL